MFYPYTHQQQEHGAAIINRPSCQLAVSSTPIFLANAFAGQPGSRVRNTSSECVDQLSNAHRVLSRWQPGSQSKNGAGLERSKARAVAMPIAAARRTRSTNWCALPLQVSYSVRSESLPMAWMHVLFHWLVGATMEDVVWHRRISSTSLDRLIAHDANGTADRRYRMCLLKGRRKDGRWRQGLWHARLSRWVPATQHHATRREPCQAMGRSAADSRTTRYGEY